MGSNENFPSQKPKRSFLAPTVAFCLPMQTQVTWPFPACTDLAAGSARTPSRFRFKSSKLVQHRCPKGRSRLEPLHDCACALGSRALQLQTLPSKHSPGLRKRACALRANGDRPRSGNSAQGPTRPPGPLRPQPSADGNDDDSEENGGGFHFGAFLSPAEAIGWCGTKEAGQIAAGSAPPVEPGDAAAPGLSPCLL